MNTQTKNVISHLKNPAFYLVLLFLALLVVPAIVWDELSEEFRSKKLTNENRAKDNKKPLLNFSDIQKYPKKFQRYYNDAFPFREYLVWSSKKVTAPVTNYYSPIVVTGKDGFLFYTNAMEKYGDESKDFKEGCLWTHARVKRLVKQFDEIRKDLAEMGIDFCMFIAPNKMKLQGYFTELFEREITTSPSSRGCLKTSKTWRGNSIISSKNRTPLCARVISPGLGFVPPPIIPFGEAV